MTRSRFSGGIVQTIEKEVGVNDASGLWGLNDIVQRVGSNDFPGSTPQPTEDYVAKGALTDGSMVVLNSDRTVSVVGGGGPESATAVSFTNSNSTGNLGSAYSVTDKKIVIFYSDSNNSNKPTAVVGTVSGTSISFGSETVIGTRTSALNCVCTYDSANNKFILFAGVGGLVYAYVGTLSGTSISVGSEANVGFGGSIVEYTSAVYDINSGKTVLTGRDASGYVQSVVLTVSGTTPSFGTSVIANSSSSYDNATTYDENAGKIAVFYRMGSSYYGRVGTVSGTSISFGSQSSGVSGTHVYMVSCYDASTQKIVVVSSLNPSNNDPYCTVWTISGTTISSGTPVNINNVRAESNTISYDPVLQKVVITNDIYNGNLQTTLGTVSGTSISYGTTITLATSTSGYVPSFPSVYDINANKTIVSTKISTVTGLSSIVFTAESSFLTSENFIGVSAGDYADGATATVQTKGATDDAQSGLTAGEDYYVQIDGTIETTPDLPSVFAGNALAPNKILVKDNYAGTDTTKVIASGALTDGSTVALNEDGTVSVVTDLIVANLTATNFLGFSAGNYSDGEAAVIQTQGATDDAQSGLFPADQYFVQIDGSIDTTPDTPEVLAGTALSPTEILIKEESSGGSATLVATGALDEGSLVMLNSDGTVSVVAGIDGVLPTFGSADSFDGSAPTTMNSIYEPVSGKVLIAYRDTGNSNYGTLQVGTVTGDRIIFGAGNVFASSNTTQYDMCLLGSGTGKFAIAYRDIGQGGGFGTMIMGTMSGNSVSFSGAMFFNGASVQSSDPKIDYSPDLDGILIAYKDNGSSLLAAGFASISGNSFVMTMTATIDTNSSSQMNDCIFDPTTGKWVILYKITSSQHEHAVHITAADTSTITIGTPYKYAESNGFQGGAYVGNGEIVVVRANSYGAYAYLAKVDGDVVSFSEPKLFSPRASPFSISADPASNEFMVAYQDTTTSDHLYAVSGKVSSGNISITDPTPVYENKASDMSVAYDTVEQKYSIAYRHSSPGTSGEAVVTTGNGSPPSTNLTANNFLGFSDGAYADGETATIHTRGSVSDDQSGLEATEEYYVQGNGSLEKTPDNPSVFAGTSIGPTKIVVKGSSDSQSSLQVVASGALANGDMVVLNEDNSVSVVSSSSSAENIGPETLLTTNTLGFISPGSMGVAYYSSRDMVVVVYRGGRGSSSGGYPSVKVGTISGDTITFGVENIIISESVEYLRVVYDENADRLVFFYQKNPGNPARAEAVVGEVASDGSITFGTATRITDSGANSGYIQAIYLPDDKKVFVAWQESVGTAPNNGLSAVGEVDPSANTISFGGTVQFQATNSTYGISCLYDNINKKVVIFYQYSGGFGGGDSQYHSGYVIVGEISGNTVSYGPAINFWPSTANNIVTGFDPEQGKILVKFVDLVNSSQTVGIVGTVSGMGVNFGSSQVIDTNNHSESSLLFNPDSKKFDYFYITAGTNVVTKTAEISGDSIIFGTDLSISANANIGISTAFAYDPVRGQVVTAYSESEFGTTYNAYITTYSPDYTSKNLTASNFLGVSDADYADGELATIQTKGSTDDAQTGLVSGERYFVQIDGSIETTADNPRVFAGTAASSTEIAVKGTDPNQPTVDLVTSGDLSDGSIAIVNSDGTVGPIIQTPVLEGLTDSKQLTNTNSGNVVGYHDSVLGTTIIATANFTQSRGCIYAGTISGDTFTSPSGAQNFTGNSVTNELSICGDPSTNRIFVAYQESGNSQGYVVAGQINNQSGNTTFGTPVVFNSNSTTNISCSFDPESGKVLIVYNDRNIAGSSIFASTSGTTLTVSTGDVSTFYSGLAQYTCLSYDPIEKKHLAVWMDSTNNKSQSIVIYIDENNDIQFGSGAKDLAGAQSSNFAVVYDPVVKVHVVVYTDINNYGVAVAGKIVANEFSQGTPVVFTPTNTTGKIGITYDVKSGKVVIAYRNQADNESGYMVYGKSDANYVLTFNTPTQRTVNGESFRTCVYDTVSEQTMIVHIEGTSGNQNPYYRMLSPGYDVTNLTATNFIGVSDGDYADGETATVQLRGAVDDAQSGLTPDSTYYVQQDGSINTTVDNPSVLAGTAIDSNLLLIKE